MKILLELPIKLFAFVSLIFTKGLSYWLGYIATYIYLTSIERFSRKRFPSYDLTQFEDPEKNGFFVPRREYKLEAPQNDVNILKDKTDDVFCYGTNSNSEGLAIHISRLTTGQVRCSLFLKLEDGQEFCLPEEHLLQQGSTEDLTFGSSRLKLQCLIPMRKWRIFFNGVLKKDSKNDEDSEDYIHVNLVLIFTASSDAYDFTTHFSKNVLAHDCTASASWTTPPIFFAQKMRDIFNCYEQSGLLLGTVKIEGNERDLYLWGSRGHYMGRTMDLEGGNFIEAYGSFQNGALVHLGFLTLPGYRSKFQYGYLMKSDGFIHPIEKINMPIDLKARKSVFMFSSGGIDYEWRINQTLTDRIEFQNEFSGSASAKFVDMTLITGNRNMKGKGFIFDGSIEKAPSSIVSPMKHFSESDWKNGELAVSFEAIDCQNSALTGGKGSSLAKLYSLSNLMCTGPLKFEVPKGLVVTTAAYKLFAKRNVRMLYSFKNSVWKKEAGESKELCQKLVDEMARQKLPERIRISLQQCLDQVFSDGYLEKKFAVRSSATGEDTEQMSAAGQMETFLGLKTLDQIFEAVIKCWASQFSFQAVEYKRRYGQPLNSPMAVVVQEMIPCEVAGVAFTCDPVTGNPSYINITGNYGLGESVVSASSEPDTIVLKRNIYNKIKLHSYQVGTKHTKIVMDDVTGTKEVMVEENSSVSGCLSDTMALKLGQIAVKIEEYFGSSRDLEWGIFDDNIFLFQSRPITSLDSETDFEAKHFFDTYMRTETEYFSKANVGEVLPGATSPLGINIFQSTMSMSYEKQRVIRFEGGPMPAVPYFEKRLSTSYCHIFFNLLDGFLRFEEKNVEATKALMISLFGRSVDEDKMTEIACERHSNKSASLWKLTAYTTWVKFMAGFWAEKRFKELKSYKPSLKLDGTPLEILYSIGQNIGITANSMAVHLYCSICSSSWNMDIMSLLAKSNGEWDNAVYNDIAYLLSTCTEIESADVPAAIQKLGYTISNSPEANEFKNMNLEQAEKYLLTSKTPAATQFRDFLEKHGHRCVKEFDVISSPWGEDRKPLIKMIQGLINPNIKDPTHKKNPSFEEILSKMCIKLSFMERMKLRWLLPNCRRGVREREFSKSILIKSYDMVRKMLQVLSEVLVGKGYLPKKKLIYFLCAEEINQLIRTRSPKLVAKALKRMKFYDELDKLKFPEIFGGIPKPVNFYDDDANDVSTGTSMTGIPVSRGVAKGTARVVKHLDDAVNIKAGDILIAYSTDIGWSPYFPLLSGVVTELGGLISHGAVVAREYGLPCVVALHGATSAFKSGDTVLLDGNKGTLTRIET